MLKPLIGITCGSRTSPPNKTELYHEAIIKACGIPEFIYLDADPEDLAQRYAGLLIPGGRDLPPSLYNEDQSFLSNIEDADRIRFDFSFLDRMLRYNKPVLGICYGMQLINVFLGGTLYQDIASQVPGALEHRAGTHEITIVSNPFIPAGTSLVNTSHHQAVKQPGTGLSPLAFSSDGIMEAFYSGDHYFLAGVQWHPERTGDDLSCLIFSQFLTACSFYKSDI